MIRIQITKNGAVTNQSDWLTDAEAEAWYQDQLANFPAGHVKSKTDVTAEHAAKQAAKIQRVADEARLETLKTKPVLTTPELTEAVKLLLSLR